MHVKQGAHEPSFPICIFTAVQCFAVHTENLTINCDTLNMKNWCHVNNTDMILWKACGLTHKLSSARRRLMPLLTTLSACKGRLSWIWLIEAFRYIITLTSFAYDNCVAKSCVSMCVPASLQLSAVLCEGRPQVPGVPRGVAAHSSGSRNHDAFYKETERWRVEVRWGTPSTGGKKRNPWALWILSGRTWTCDEHANWHLVSHLLW